MKPTLLFALLLAACATPGSHGTSDVDALLAADRAFARDTQVRRLEGWLAAFDERGSQFDDEAGLVSGHAAIRLKMAGYFADPGNELTWEPDGAQVSEHGALGSTTGRYRFTYRQRDGTLVTEIVGRYFDVWRRLPDGRWKLLFDVGDPDAPK